MLYLKTSVLASIMICNLEKKLRIVGLHRHYEKPNLEVFQPLTTAKTICHYAN